MGGLRIQEATRTRRAVVVVAAIVALVLAVRVVARPRPASTRRSCVDAWVAAEDRGLGSTVDACGTRDEWWSTAERVSPLWAEASDRDEVLAEVCAQRPRARLCAG